MRLIYTLMLSLLVVSSGVSVAADFVKAVSVEGQALPPSHAPIGEKVGGTRIGVWTNDAYCHQGKAARFWVYAKGNQRGIMTASSGNNLYKDSYLYIYNNYDEVARVPVDAPAMDVSGKGYSAGCFALPANLPKGLYTIQWRTAKMESNAIDIEVL